MNVPYRLVNNVICFKFILTINSGYVRQWFIDLFKNSRSDVRSCVGVKVLLDIYMKSAAGQAILVTRLRGISKILQVEKNVNSTTHSVQ